MEILGYNINNRSFSGGFVLLFAVSVHPLFFPKQRENLFERVAFLWTLMKELPSSKGTTFSSCSGQYCAKGNWGRSVRCSEDAQIWGQNIQLCGWLTCISALHHIFFYCFAPASEELTLTLQGRFTSGLVPCCLMRAQRGRQRFKASHSPCSAGCKARTFWMRSFTYFGKLIKFSEVGQLFLSLSRHAFNAGSALDAVKVDHFFVTKFPSPGEVSGRCN